MSIGEGPKLEVREGDQFIINRVVCTVKGEAQPMPGAVRINRLSDDVPDEPIFQLEGPDFKSVYATRNFLLQCVPYGIEFGVKLDPEQLEGLDYLSEATHDFLRANGLSTDLRNKINAAIGEALGKPWDRLQLCGDPEVIRWAVKTATRVLLLELMHATSPHGSPRL